MIQVFAATLSLTRARKKTYVNSPTMLTRAVWWHFLLPVSITLLQSNVSDQSLDSIACFDFIACATAVVEPLPLFSDWLVSLRDIFKWQNNYFFKTPQLVSKWDKCVFKKIINREKKHTERGFTVDISSSRLALSACCSGASPWKMSCSSDSRVLLWKSGCLQI